jgi:hypothetical protein
MYKTQKSMEKETDGQCGMIDQIDVMCCPIPNIICYITSTTVVHTIVITSDPTLLGRRCISVSCAIHVARYETMVDRNGKGKRQCPMGRCTNIVIFFAWPRQH